jgi:hypothetical protein
VLGGAPFGTGELKNGLFGGMPAVIPTPFRLTYRSEISTSPAAALSFW